MTGRHSISLQSRPPTGRIVALLVLFLALPALGVLGKVTHGVSLFLAFVGFSVVAGLVLRLVLPLYFGRLSEPVARWCAVATAFALLGLVVVLYPVANTGIPGRGSDGDDALDMATSALLEGEYPYHAHTYLDNPISPLPGGLIFSAPFVAAFGNAMYQNLIWIVILAAFMHRRTRDVRWALGLLWLVALNPSTLHKLVIGGDYVANSVAVLVLMWWLLMSTDRLQHVKNSLAPLLVPAILLGVALSWRVNFLLVTPLLYSLLVQRVGWRTATGVAVVAGVTFISVTLPFYLYDPAGFSPLHVSSKIGRFNEMLPHACLVVAALSGAVALLLCLPRWNNSEARFFINCALVQLVPLLAGALLEVAARGTLTQFTMYGEFMLFFGVVGAWLTLHDHWHPALAAPTSSAPALVRGLAASPA